MQSYQNSILRVGGYPLSGASILVKTSSGATASIFSDNLGTPAANPLTSDALGNFQFWAADGVYSIVISASGLVTQTITGIHLEDQLSIDTGTSADATPLNGAEFITMSRGAGLLQSTLTKVGTWCLQTFLGYTQNGTGAVSRTIQNKAQDIIHVRDFGAKGDGVTDDTASIQAAVNYANTLNGSVVSFNSGIFLVSTLNIYGNITFSGYGGSLNIGTNMGTTILGTGGNDIFVPAGSVGVSINSVIFEKLQISGGQNAINFGQVGITNLVIRDCRISGQSAASVTAGMWMERCVFDHCELLGGTYGFAMTNNGSATNNYMDKMLFSHVRFSGSISGFFKDTARVSAGDTFINPIFNNCGTHAFQCLGSASDWDIVNPVVEANGFSGPAKAITSGSITNGTNTLTVASATNLVNGQQITIQAAAANGADLITTITNIVGTTVTTFDNAGATVTSSEVTNCLYDEFFFGPPSQGSGNAARVNFIGGLLGPNGTSDKIRYAINSSAAFLSCAAGRNSSRPIYDPKLQMGVYNWAGVFRTQVQSSWAAGIFSQARIGQWQGSSNTFNPALAIVPGNPGSGLEVVLRGNGDGNEQSGTYGSFNVMQNNSGRLNLLSVNADTGVTTSRLSIDINIAGQGLRVAEGSNAKQGTATLSSGTVVVSNTSVTATSRIFLTAQDNNTVGALRVSARTAGTSFTITSSTGTDSGVVSYEIFEPG